MILSSLLILGSKALARPSSSTFERRPKPAANDPLKSAFLSPPDRAKPWVYWYFMDGNMTKEGLRAEARGV